MGRLDRRAIDIRRVNPEFREKEKKAEEQSKGGSILLMILGGLLGAVFGFAKGLGDAANDASRTTYRRIY